MPGSIRGSAVVTPSCRSAPASRRLMAGTTPFAILTLDAPSSRLITGEPAITPAVVQATAAAVMAAMAAARAEETAAVTTRPAGATIPALACRARRAGQTAMAAATRLGKATTGRATTRRQE